VIAVAATATDEGLPVVVERLDATDRGAVLAEREDRVVRRTEIYDLVWGGTMKRRDRSVDVFVRKVRDKLARVSSEWTYIHTHFGIGS